jgi:hypothetical protein
VIDGVWMIEEIACVKCGVANELKRAAVDPVRPRFGQHISEARRSVTDFRRHHPRERLHFLNRVDIKIGKCGAPKLGIGGISPVHGKD